IRYSVVNVKVDRSVSSPAERILAAADKLFYAQGIRAAGVDTVAAEAGVSKRTLYNHYPSKDALIAAYLTARFKHLAPSDAPAREQILGNFDRLERLVADGSLPGLGADQRVARRAGIPQGLRLAEDGSMSGGASFAARLEQEPSASLGFVDPHFDQAGGG